LQLNIIILTLQNISCKVSFAAKKEFRLTDKITDLIFNSASKVACGVFYFISKGEAQ
jgi:hypothetical protein